jgi:glycosyltransferase involved in cell wall biosynthesis
MKIGVNVHLLSFSADYRQTGIGLYIENLLKHLAPMIGSEDINLLGYDRNIKKHFNSYNFIPSNIDTTSPIKRIFWEQLVSHNVVCKENIDIYHCPMHVIPILPKKKPYKTVITVHDLANFKFPQFYKGFKQKYLTTLTRLSAQLADRIIAVSENTKKDIIEILNIPESKIDVVYNGNNLQIPKDLDIIHLDIEFPKQYILFVGTLEPRKNLEGLIKSLIFLAEKKKRLIPLVIAGPLGWKYAKIQAMAEQYQLMGGNIIQTGYLKPDELCAIYKKATIFVYPSFYEGFGFPVLEAMSLGVPVITSNISSLTEVGGDAVQYIDPNSIEDLANKVNLLFGNDYLCQELSIKSKKRSNLFNWKAAASQTLQTYNKTMEG